MPKLLFLDPSEVDHVKLRFSGGGDNGSDFAGAHANKQTDKERMRRREELEQMRSNEQGVSIYLACHSREIGEG